MGWWAGWLERRTCPHNWELIEKQKILGGPPREIPCVEWHYIYVYRCRNCGTIKRKNDRWSPIQ